ncbi:Dabb family protein (plasmid) [Rhizobium johnstonii]|nr:Dabb family protein [Rhizobium johnstonii]
MIKHIVMWDVRGDSAEEKQAAAFDLKTKFESLRGEIPGLLFLEVGINFRVWIMPAMSCSIPNSRTKLPWRGTPPIPRICGSGIP